MTISLKEINNLKKTSICLKYNTFSGNVQIIGGLLKVNHVYNDFAVNESFDIEIEIPKEYPYAVPSIKEIGYKISKQYPHIYPNGHLCLGVDGEILLKCNGVMNLKYLIDSYVIPYFYTYRYYERFNQYPFGERMHGYIGILESYNEILGLEDFKKTYNFLKFAISHQYQESSICPCKSGKIVRDCHSNFLQKINKNKFIKEAIKNDLKIVEGGRIEKEQRRSNTI